MRNCTCEKWDDNIYILNAPYTLNMSAIGEYAGDDFVYCPWCGCRLLDEPMEHEDERIRT